jgi:hypothetical protein
MIIEVELINEEVPRQYKFARIDYDNRVVSISASDHSGPHTIIPFERINMIHVIAPFNHDPNTNLPEANTNDQTQH